MRRWLLPGGAIVLVAVLVVGWLAARPSRRRVDCKPLLETARGSYPSLATVDTEGFVYPFSKITLDDGARWELEIQDAYGGKRRIGDVTRIRRLQRIEFRCTDGDYGTPETTLRLLRDGALTYDTDVVLGEGLQNRELGFIEANNRLAFWWLLRP
jgi:hypothetical protein